MKNIINKKVTLMIFFLFISSRAESINKIGLYERKVQENEAIQFDLKGGAYNAHIFSKEIKSVKATFNTTNETDYEFTTEMEDFVAVTLSGKKAEINFSDPISVKIWILEKSECSGGAAFYSTKQYIHDELTPATPIRDFICIFSNFGTNSSITSLIETRNKELIPIIEYKEFSNDAVAKQDKCSNLRCEIASNDAGYLRFTSIDGNATFIYAAKFASPLQISDTCQRSILSTIIENTVEEKFFKPKRHELDCSPFTTIDRSYYNFYYAAAMIIIASAALLMCAYMGWCSILSSFVFGGRDESHNEMLIVDADDAGILNDNDEDELH